MNAIFKNFVIRKTSLFGLLAALSASSYADVMDQLELGSEFGTEVRNVKEYDPSISKYDRSQDQHNPFLGKLHRTADSGFSPQSDLSLFIKRMREGVSLYKKRGVTKFSNQYNLFKTIYAYLPGKSLGEDGGQPVVAKFRRSPQLFLIYRIYEAKDGRAKLLCYDNSEGRIGSSGLVGQRKTYAIWGYKLKKGYRFTEGGVTGKPVYFDLVDPHGKLMDESEYDNGIVSRIRDAQDKSEKVDSILGADDEWESNPPHPDNIGYTDGQIDKKVEGKKDIFKTILDPLMFGAKLGVGAYMLKEAFKKKDDDDDDDDEFGGDYGYGMDYGMGYGSEYGMGSIMGPGNMMGMYPGMYPGMQPGMYPGMYPGMQPGMMPPMMPPAPPIYQQPGFPGVYPGQTPGGSFPGAQPFPGPDYTMPLPGDYPGVQPGPYQPPIQGGPYQPPMQGGPIGAVPSPPPLGGYNPSPIGPYNPPGTDSNMIPIPGNTAPMAPGSSNLQGGNSTVIQHNDNTFLTTIGE